MFPLYNAVFLLLDSVSTLHFLLGFTALYLILHPVVFKLLALSNKGQLGWPLVFFEFLSVLRMTSMIRSAVSLSELLFSSAAWTMTSRATSSAT